MAGKKYAAGDPYVYQLTLKALLKKPLLNCPEREIVYRDSVRITYGELGKRVHCLAHLLSQNGIGVHDTVAGRLG